MSSYFPSPPQQTPLVTPATGVVTNYWFLNIFQKLVTLINSGYTGTITTAKLTTGGTEGSMTFKNGVLVSEVAAS